MAMESNSQRYNPRRQSYCGDGDSHDPDDYASDSEEMIPYRPRQLSSSYYHHDDHERGNFNDDVSDEAWDGDYAGNYDNSNENYDTSNYNANDDDLCVQKLLEDTLQQHDILGIKSDENNFHDLHHNSEHSYSEEEQSSYDNIRREEADLIERSEWHFSDTDFNQIQHPQSIDFDLYYYEDDQHRNVVDNVPMREVSFHQREQNFEFYQNDTQSFDDENFEYTQNDYQSYDEISRCYDEIDDHSVDEDYSLNSENNACHRSMIKSSAEPIFQSSDSLNVIQRIESVMETLLMCIDRKEEPILRGYVSPKPYEDRHEFDSANHAVEECIPGAMSNGDPKFYRSIGNIAQSRSFTSICLVMYFIHQLLLSNRTTTTREVFYVFVTHFRNQRECDGVILDVAKVLGVSRRSLGLFASPKGWFCGCIEITRKGTLPSGKDVSGFIDGTALCSIQGLPITKEWTERDENGCTDDGIEIKVTSKNAKVILVIEKEGVYNRLSEERIFDRFPCILVTGKGFPDLATRALVSTLHRELGLPVEGLCDCNPFGISVLALYHCAGDRMGVDGRRRYTVPIQWLGLRPSKVARLKNKLPETVFQKLTDLDNKRIDSLLDPEHPYLTEDDCEEVRKMKAAGYKVELEALYWIGPEYICSWVVNILEDKLATDNN
ncbi:hypothetical protein ACHAXH_009236 [Discostella pseudostelligera]